MIPQACLQPDSKKSASSISVAFKPKLRPPWARPWPVWAGRPGRQIWGLTSVRVPDQGWWEEDGMGSRGISLWPRC